jgi:hypothetical protein
MLGLNEGVVLGDDDGGNGEILGAIDGEEVVEVEHPVIAVSTMAVPQVFPRTAL